MAGWVGSLPPKQEDLSLVLSCWAGPVGASVPQHGIKWILELVGSLSMSCVKFRVSV